MKKMEKTWQAHGLCDLRHGTVHDCHHCYRSYNKKLTASLLRTPKTAEFEERHVPALHYPLHQHGQCVLMTEKETMRGPPLHCQQLCTQSSRSPSECGSGDESDENLDNLFPDSPVRIPRQRRCVRVLQDYATVFKHIVYVSFIPSYCTFL